MKSPHKAGRGGKQLDQAKVALRAWRARLLEDEFSLALLAYLFALFGLLLLVHWLAG